MASRRIPRSSSHEQKETSSHPTAKVNTMKPQVQILRKDSTDVRSERHSKPKPSTLFLSFDAVKKGDSNKMGPCKMDKQIKQPLSNEALTTNVVFQLSAGDFPDLVTTNLHTSSSTSPNTRLSTQAFVAPKQKQNPESTKALSQHDSKAMKNPASAITSSSAPPKMKSLSSTPHVHLQARGVLVQKSSQPPQSLHKKSTETAVLMPSSSHDPAAFFAHMPVGRGRQKLGPKKKKLTALKKHILLQRLDRWKITQETAKDKESSSSSINDDTDTIVLRISNFILDGDSILDEDEYNECLSDLLDLATKVGPVKEVLIPQSTKIERGVFVLFQHATDARAARACWNELVLSGQRLTVSLLSKEALICQGIEINISQGKESSEMDWKDILLELDDSQLASAIISDEGLKTVNHPASRQLCDSSGITLLLNNILSEDDFEDEECLEESISDIIELVGKYGNVVQDKIYIERSEKNRGQVRLVLEATKDMALFALQDLNCLILGGRKVLAQIADNVIESNLSNGNPISHQTANTTSTLILSNIFRDDDYEDNECLEETKRDIMRLAAAFGTVLLVNVKLSGEDKGQLHIQYLEGDCAVNAAMNNLDGMILGGYPMKAVSRPKDEESPPPEPLLSNDKIIPEKYAECKRVPKVPFSDPRDYVVLRNDDTVKSLLIEMLGELMRLQIRSQDDKNSKARRRLVMGFREVARGLRAHKIKMIVLACNCDQYDAVDNTVQDILSLAKDQEVAIFFELNKRHLGKALGKTIKVSVVGIQNADGAHEQFKRLKVIADRPCIT